MLGRWLLLFVCFVLGCVHRGQNSFEPLNAESNPPNSDPLGRHEAYVEIRSLHQRCEVLKIELEEEIQQADDRENRYAVVAAIAAHVGEHVDSDSESIPRGSDCISSSQTTSAAAAAPCDNPLNNDVSLQSRRSGQGSPLQMATVDARQQPTVRIRAIDRASDALDTFVFSNPDPNRWTPEKRSEFQQHISTLELLCGS